MGFFKKIISSKSFSYILFLMLLFILISLGREIVRQINIKKELNYLETHVSDLELENQKLLKQLEEIKTEYFAEKAARLKMGLMKPGERLIVVLPNEELKQNKEQEIKSKGIFTNLKLWWCCFFSCQQEK